MIKKYWWKILLGILIAFIVLCGYFYSRYTPATEFTWGLNFSEERARELGFEPYDVYRDMLADLKPTKVRLVAYWDQIEQERGKYDFKLMDSLLALSEKSQVQVILVVGRKEPRWPECHEPAWVPHLGIEEQFEVRQTMITDFINHFKSSPAIKIWQVENEPLFSFGHDCPRMSKDELSQEVALVKSLDNRLVLVADSGELGRWLPTASTGADLFGTTMYRVVHNNITGYWKYPLPPGFFRIKAGLIQTFTDIRSIAGVELQAEPWLIDGVYGTPVNTQLQLMNPKIFTQNIEYAKGAGFSDNYLWGAEWWYWMAKKQGDYGMWTVAKELLSGK